MRFYLFGNASHLPSCLARQTNTLHWVTVRTAGIMKRKPTMKLGQSGGLAARGKGSEKSKKAIKLQSREKPTAAHFLR